MLWLLALGSALAGDLALDWTQRLRYFSDVRVGLPNGYPFIGRTVDGTARGLELSAELECSGRWSGAIQAVNCSARELRLDLEALSTDEREIAIIEAEYQSELAGAVWQLQVGPDGRFRTVDLEGVGKADDRQATIHENLRQIARRLLTPLELAMPRRGEAPKGRWKQAGSPLLFQLFTAWGSSGGATMVHRVARREGGEARVESEGRAVMATNLDREVGAGQAVSLVGGGSARVDLANRRILWRQVAVNGELTASSIQPGVPEYYDLVGWAGLVREDGQVELETGPGPRPSR